MVCVILFFWTLIRIVLGLLSLLCRLLFCFFFFKQMSAYELRISAWSSALCSSDLSRRRVMLVDDSLIARRRLVNLFKQMNIECVAALGGLQIMVSNAGIQHIDPVDKLAYADWRKVVSIHLDGAFLCSRAALRQMYAAGQGGAILYLGSVHSKLASPLKAPYVAAKHDRKTRV